ncbi:hypothetical protein LINPERHAP2_LOCUS45968 [Linum perenne]
MGVRVTILFIMLQQRA